MPSSRPYGFYFNNADNVDILKPLLLCWMQGTSPSSSSKLRQQQPWLNLVSCWQRRPPLQRKLLRLLRNWWWSKRGGTSEKDLKEINWRIRTIFTPVYPFGNAPLETKDKICVNAKNSSSRTSSIYPLRGWKFQLLSYGLLWGAKMIQKSIDPSTLK